MSSHWGMPTAQWPPEDLVFTHLIVQSLATLSIQAEVRTSIFGVLLRSAERDISSIS